MIKVKNLTKKYDGGITALDNISFELHKGEITGLIGTNGAGENPQKLSKILSGLLDYNSGRL